MAGDRRAELFDHQVSHHRDSFATRLRDGSVEMWLVDDNADYWGSCLPLVDVEPFFRALPPTRLLTVGDGKGGKEAAFLKRLGHHAVATDVCTDVLGEAKRRGIIDEFREADAEALPFDDGEFDYVLVKETLHHLTRPYLAIHEMLRVASRGVVIMEPRAELGTDFGLRSCLRYIMGRLFRVCSLPIPAMLPQPLYEAVAGNYCFRFHPYDLGQIAMAAGCEAVAWGWSRVYWEAGCGKIKGDELVALIERETRKMERGEAKWGRHTRPVLQFMIFKKAPSADAVGALEASGFNVKRLEGPPGN